MKKNSFLIPLILVMIGIIVTLIYFNKTTTSENKEEGTNMKTLIVYYSRTGNTQAVAELIQDEVGGDLFQIETKEERPTDYREEVSQNEEEQANQVLPELKTKVEKFDEYNRIFIGSPTWNMALPQAVVTFLDEYNFSGKTVIPFNTNGGYGEGAIFKQIEEGTKGATVLKGFSVKGGEEINGILLAIKGNKKVEVSKEINNWLRSINQE